MNHHISLLPADKFRSRVGWGGVSDTRNAAWRLQKMTVSRCMNRWIGLFALCATADGEINAGWTSYGRFVWFPQCHVYISLGFLLQSWPPCDPWSSVHLGWAVTCLPSFSYWGGSQLWCSGRGHLYGSPPHTHFVHASNLPRFSPWGVVYSTGWEEGDVLFKKKFFWLLKQVWKYLKLFERRPDLIEATLQKYSILT